MSKRNKRLSVYVLLKCSSTLADEKIISIHLTKEAAETQKVRLCKAQLRKEYYAVLKHKVKGNYSLHEWPNVTIGVLRMPKKGE